jgi:hypothetical protein
MEHDDDTTYYTPVTLACPAVFRDCEVFEAPFTADYNVQMTYHLLHSLNYAFGNLDEEPRLITLYVPPNQKIGPVLKRINAERRRWKPPANPVEYKSTIEALRLFIGMLGPFVSDGQFPAFGLVAFYGQVRYGSVFGPLSTAQVCFEPTFYYARSTPSPPKLPLRLFVGRRFCTAPLLVRHLILLANASKIRFFIASAPEIRH